MEQVIRRSSTDSVGPSSGQYQAQNDIQTFDFQAFDGHGLNDNNFVREPRLQKVKKKEHLFHEGDKAIYFYQVIYGMFKTYRFLQDGRRLINTFAGRGDYLALTQKGRHSFSAQAVTNSGVRCYSHSTLDSLLQSSCQAAGVVLAYTHKELTGAQDQMMLLGRKSPCEKVASFLLECNRLPIVGNPGVALLDVPMSLTDIADYLGLAKETVCREIGKLKDLGVVAANASPSPEFHVLDIEKLRALADKG